MTSPGYVAGGSAVAALQCVYLGARRDLVDVGAFAKFDLFYLLATAGDFVGRNGDLANVFFGLFEVFVEIADTLIKRSFTTYTELKATWLKPTSEDFSLNALPQLDSVFADIVNLTEEANTLTF